MNLEEARRKRMAELQDLQNERMQELVNEQIRVQHQVAQIEKAATMWMDNEARSRYGNLKLAHPETALQVAVLIAKLVQEDKIKKTITDEQLKELLIYLNETKHESKLNFKR